MPKTTKSTDRTMTGTAFGTRPLTRREQDGAVECAAHGVEEGTAISAAKLVNGPDTGSTLELGGAAARNDCVAARVDDRVEASALAAKRGRHCFV